MVYASTHGWAGAAACRFVFDDGVPTGINTMAELARDPRPVSSFADTFFLLANQSKDPDLHTISQTYIVHYDMAEAIMNASQSKVVMCEATTFLQYLIRLHSRSRSRYF